MGAISNVKILRMWFLPPNETFPMKRHSKLSDKRPSNFSKGFIYISKTGESTNFLKEIISEKRAAKNNITNKSEQFSKVLAVCI